MKNNLFIWCIILGISISTSLSASNKVDSLKHILTTNISDSQRVILNYKLYWHLNYVDIAVAREYAIKGLELSRKIGYKKYEGKCLRGLGILYHTQRELDSARIYFIEALKIFEEIPDSIFIGYCFNDIASTYYRYGNSKIKLEYFQKAYSIIKNYDKPKQQVSILENIGQVYYSSQNYNQALKYFFEALDLMEKTNLKQNEFLLYLLGSYYKRFELFDKSHIMLTRALAASIKNNNRAYECYTYEMLAYLFMEEQNYDSAGYYLEKTQLFKDELYFTTLRNHLAFSKYYLLVDSLDKVGESLMLAEQTDEFKGDSKEYGPYSPTRLFHLIIKSSYYRKRKLPSKCLDELTAIPQDSLSLIPDKLDLHTELSKVYSQMGNADKAFEHLNLAMQWKDSMNVENNRQLIIEKELTYSFEKKKQLQESFQQQQQLKIELELSRKKKVNMFLVIIIAFVLILTLVIYINFRQKRKDNKLLNEQKKAIEEKEKLTKNLLKELNHRVKNNLQMVASLFTMQQYNTTDMKVKQALKKASGRIDSLIVLHQYMYTKDNPVEPDTKKYIEELSEKIINASDSGDCVNLKLNIESIKLNITQLTHIGIVTNELLTNAIKYGVKKEETNFIEFSVYFKLNCCVLNVRNEIIKEKKNALHSKNNGHFGLKLVEAIAQQYNGSLKAEFTSKANVEVLLHLD
jgi:two-component sensor histidine kinase